jgi:hypothetical protein
MTASAGSAIHRGVRGDVGRQRLPSGEPPAGGGDARGIEPQVGEPFDGSVPWVLFVDGQGVLRAAAAANETGLHAKVAKWARLFRPRDR